MSGSADRGKGRACACTAIACCLVGTDILMTTYRNYKLAIRSCHMTCATAARTTVTIAIMSVIIGTTT